MPLRPRLDLSPRPEEIEDHERDLAACQSLVEANPPPMTLREANAVRLLQNHLSGQIPVKKKALERAYMALSLKPGDPLPAIAEHLARLTQAPPQPLDKEMATLVLQRAQQGKPIPEKSLVRACQALGLPYPPPKQP